MSSEKIIVCGSCRSYRFEKTSDYVPQYPSRARALAARIATHFGFGPEIPRQAGVYRCDACQASFTIVDPVAYSRAHRFDIDRCPRCDQHTIEVVARALPGDDSGELFDKYRCADCGARVHLLVQGGDNYIC